ncbi:uncharacterized protein LOC117339208 [Pecten maximus]|uniref:uncharacterized protein LOC117339208 n=1 Tax=Pecten maximus TaxID=6579 RepID=UPI0014591628|nr:uncharacterized protein LOC117339208 [Pecten maximus]
MEYLTEMGCQSIVVICVFVTITSLYTVEAGYRGRSRCYRQSAVSLDSPTNHTIPGICKKGSMTWHYPTGNMIIHFQPRNPHNRTMWVCVQERATDGMFIFDITRNTERGLPSNGEPHFAVCVPAVDGRVDLKWVAPQELHYMASLLYTVVKIPR